jgi:transposase
MTDLSCGQVAKLLGVRRETVWRWAQTYSETAV